MIFYLLLKILSFKIQADGTNVQPVELGDKLYYFGSTLVNHNDAKRICSVVFGNAQLVAIYNCAIQSSLKNIINNILSGTGGFIVNCFFEIVLLRCN